MSKQKLCLVIPSMGVGGMERVMSELAYYFCKKNDLEVHMVLYGKAPVFFYKVPENLEIHLPSFGFNDRLRFICSVLRLIYLRREVKKINPGSVLSFGEYWNSFVLLALLATPYPVYISDRCSPEKKFRPGQSILRKWLYPRAKGIIAQTNTAKIIYDKHFKNKNTSVIGNPIRFVPDDKIPVIRKKIVLSIGRLINTKNHDKLIEMFCDINKKGWKLIIVGGDALKQQNMIRLNELINRLNAKNSVFLMGKITDIDRFYLESSIFVSTSDSEGFPNVIGEAMSAALPVVAFDCVAGPSDMITGGEDGFLIQVNDYASFRERLEQLMNDKLLREQMGAKAKKSIKRYSIGEIGEEFYKFILPR